MRILYWPQCGEKDSGDVSLEDFLSRLKLKKHPDLWTLVRNTIKKAEEPQGWAALRGTGWVRPLREIKEPIWEFRIPPTRRGGVVRIYFCHKGDDSIVCLVGEFKKRVEASSQKIHQAQMRYREVCK